MSGARRWGEETTPMAVRLVAAPEIAVLAGLDFPCRDVLTGKQQEIRSIPALLDVLCLDQTAIVHPATVRPVYRGGVVSLGYPVGIAVLIVRQGRNSDQHR